jgi:hypothetical protein
MLGYAFVRWLREAGESPARTRHCNVAMEFTAAESDLAGHLRYLKRDA